MKTTRRELRRVPLEDAIAAIEGHRGGEVIVTMSEGQWDAVHAAAYASGAILLELDRYERPVRAFQRATGESIH